MSKVISGLGWDCEEEFLCSAAGRIATVSGRGYYKMNDIPAICVMDSRTGVYRQPKLISTDPTATSYRADSGGPWDYTVNGMSFEYLGVTWYYFEGNHGFYNGSYSSDYPALDFAGCTTMEERGKYILEQAGVVTAGYYTVHFDPGSGYGSMKDEYIHTDEATALRANTFVKVDHTFIGWDTDSDADTVVYTDGQSVTNIADEGEDATLYAVWRKAWAWLIGDSSGNIYTVVRDAQTGEQTRQQLTGISSLTAAIFHAYGFQFQPDSSVLIDLPSPRIWKWDEAQAPSLKAVVEAVPIIPQLVVFDTLTLASTVKYVNITADDNSLWNVSFDGGSTWYEHNGLAWSLVSNTGAGCLKRKLEILPASVWAQKVNGTLKFRVWLVADSWVKRIRVDY